MVKLGSYSSVHVQNNSTVQLTEIHDITFSGTTEHQPGTIKGTHACLSEAIRVKLRSLRKDMETLLLLGFAVSL